MEDQAVMESVSGAGVEVAGVAKRRRHSAEYKRRILDEVDRARSGEIGLILRREGLYSSQLAKWRNWRSGSMPRKKTEKETVLLTDYQRLEKENAKLKLKLRKAEAMLELQKKAREILGYDDESDESSS